MFFFILKVNLLKVRKGNKEEEVIIKKGTQSSDVQN